MQHLLYKLLCPVIKYRTRPEFEDIDNDAGLTGIGHLGRIEVSAMMRNSGLRIRINLVSSIVDLTRRVVGSTAP
jgi:hypothetical protein